MCVFHTKEAKMPKEITLLGALIGTPAPEPADHYPSFKKGGCCDFADHGGHTPDRPATPKRSADYPGKSGKARRIDRTHEI